MAVVEAVHADDRHVVGRRVQEAAAARVDPDVLDGSVVGSEEDEVAGTEATPRDARGPRVGELLVGIAGQVDTVRTVYDAREPGAVDPT